MTTWCSDPRIRRAALVASFLAAGLALAQWSKRKLGTTQDAAKRRTTPNVARCIFLGSGSSAGTPLLRCLLGSESKCAVCADAISGVSTKNARTPPCLLMVVKSTDGIDKNILMDCGPAFKNQFMTAHQAIGVKTVDAVLLTHSHCDAMLGLNDLREVQNAKLEESGQWSTPTTIPVFGMKETLDEVRSIFPFLFQSGPSRTLVGKLDAHVVQAVCGTVPKEFSVPGIELPFEAIPVWHGENYTCLGFGFGRKDKRLVYISDVSEIPETTMNHLARGGAGTIAVLVLDAMTYDNTRPTHQSVKDALSIVRALKPRRTYLVGMSCRLDHATTNDAISKEPDLPCPVELAYDGLIFDLPLDA